MAKDFNLKDYTEYNISPELTYSQSLLNDFTFEDTIAFDQSYEGVPGQNMLFYGMPIRKKKYEDISPGIWMGVDTDGRAKVNIGDDSFSLIWDGTALYVTGEITIYPDSTFGESVIINGLGISFFDGADETLEFAVSDIVTGQGTIYFFDKGNATPIGSIYGDNISAQDVIVIDATDGVVFNSDIAVGGEVGASGVVGAKLASTATAGGAIMYQMTSSLTFGIYQGSGAPTISAAKGSLYLRTDGSGTNDRAYINTNGSTTWTAIVTVA